MSAQAEAFLMEGNSSARGSMSEVPIEEMRRRTREAFLNQNF